MKILFLHLSDLHITGRDSLNKMNIDKMISALNVVGDFNEVIIILSGDCAFSGKENEYKYVKSIIGTIINQIKSKFSFNKSINVIVVPGNHDLDYDVGSLSIEKLNEIYSDNLYDKELPTEIDKLKNFFNFSKRNCCFKKESIYDFKIINFDGYSIQFDMINSALFSMKNKEDKGLHYIPSDVIYKYSNNNNADMSVVVMHHAPEWFCDSIKHELERAIMNKASIAFYGHEHYIDSKELKSNTINSTLILNGGSLCNGCNWDESSFYSGILDTSNNTYYTWQFNWNKKIYSYKKIEPVLLFSKKHTGSSPFKDEFRKKFFEDKKHIGQKNFLKRFVFPRLTDENGKDITTIEDLKEKLFDSKRILLTGNYNSGRTILLKYLFTYMSKDKIVIYIDANDINGTKIDKIIKNAFEEEYGEEELLYQSFQQRHKDEKILFFDNIDNISPHQFNIFLNSINNTFGHFIFSSKQFIEFDIYERMKNEIGEEKQTEKLTITPWYSDKRRELIKAIVKSELKYKDDIDEITDQLNLSIKSQQMYFDLNPDFITQFVEFFCRNLSQFRNNDSSVFGKVFESNLTSSIRYNAPKNISVDKIFVILSKIAYYIHKNKKYPIDERGINCVIDNYNNDYGDSISTVDIINISVQSAILTKEINTNMYKFTNRSYLSYFIAQEVSRKYNEEGYDADIIAILNYSCFGINSDILLFLIYIIDNSKILDLILRMTNEYTKDWDEFKFSTSKIGYLKGDIKYDVKQIDNSEIERIDRESVEEEKSIIQSEIFNTVNIYDYSEDEAESFLNQLIRAIALLSTISKCLPYFEHNMKKNKKEEFVKLIYELPNKIFNLWAKNIDDIKDTIIDYIKSYLASDFKKQKNKNIEEKLTHDALDILIYDSTSLLLDIYNMAVINSTKDNTIDYLSSLFEYDQEDTYMVQHLIMLSNRNKVKDFINEASDIINKNKNKLPAFLVKRIANYAIYSMRNLNHSAKASLIQKCFPENKNKNLLMITKRKEVQNN